MITDDNSVTQNIAKPLVEPEARVTYRSLDAWRGFAALWVVSFHTVTLRLANLGTLRHNPFYALSYYGRLGVPLFFVISGFCIAQAAVGRIRQLDGGWIYIKARMRRIWPPYALAAVLAWTMSILAFTLVKHGMLKSSAIASLNLLRMPLAWYLSTLTLTQRFTHQMLVVPAFWSLCYEIVFYAIVFIPLFIISRFKLRLVLANALHVVTICCLICSLVFPLDTPYPFDLWPQFGLGILVYDLLSRPKSKAPKYWCACIFGLFAANIIVIHTMSFAPTHLTTSVVSTFSVAFAVVLLALYPHDTKIVNFPPIRTLTKIGAFSYSLYLTHENWRMIVGVIWHKLGGGNGAYFLGSLIYIAASIAFAYVFFLACEKPFLSKGRSSVVKNELASRQGNAAPESGSPPVPHSGPIKA